MTRFQFIFYIPFSLLAAFGASRLLKLDRKICILLFGLIWFLLILENINKANFDSTSPTLDYITSEKLENNSLISMLKGKNTIHFPLYVGGASRNVRYLNWSTITGETIFNGYSGYIPPDWINLAEQIKQLDRQSLEKLHLLGIDYLIIHKELIGQEDINSYKNNITFLNNGLVFEDEHIEVIDLKKFKFKSTVCTTRDMKFEIQSLSYPVVQPLGTTFQLFPKITLVNPKNCYLVSKYYDRYSKIELMIEDKKQILSIRLPILIEPYEKIKINYNR